MAREVTSLGSHTDLWLPTENRFSQMALGRGGRELFPPLRQAGDVLGLLTARMAGGHGLKFPCRCCAGFMIRMLLIRARWGMAVGSAADGDFEWDLDIDHVSRWKPGALAAGVGHAGEHRCMWSAIEHGAIYGGAGISSYCGGRG